MFLQLYPCYIHMWPETHSPPIFVSQCFPFNSHLKGAKAQIKIRRFKVETRRRRDVMQPVVIRSSTGTWTCLLLGHLWPMQNNTRCKWFHRRYVESFFWEQTGDNWHESFHLRGFDTNLDHAILEMLAHMCAWTAISSHTSLCPPNDPNLGIISRNKVTCALGCFTDAFYRGTSNG